MAGTPILSQGIPREATALKATNGVGTVVVTSIVVSGALINVCTCVIKKDALTVSQLVLA